MKLSSQLLFVPSASIGSAPGCYRPNHWVGPLIWYYMAAFDGSAKQTYLRLPAMADPLHVRTA